MVSSAPAYISNVPAEIFDLILDFIPPADLQRTTLSLLQTFPEVPVSFVHLWRHVVVAREAQLPGLWRKVREDDGKRNTRSFEMRSWKGDADLMNNILGVMPQIETLQLNIGTNFSPEHLEDAFAKPRANLTRILLTFKPYVSTASYYNFLRGTYFDSCVEKLTSWPAGEVNYLSLVQTIPPRHLVDASVAPPSSSVVNISSSTPGSEELDEKAIKKEEERVRGRGNYTGHGPFPYLDEKLQSSRPRVFAQPIVLYNANCLTALSLAPVARTISHLRLRIPQRDICSSLTLDANQFPALTFLDLSTTNLRLQTNLPQILRCYPALEHLVLDYVNLFGFLGRDRDKGRECCHDLGKMIVMAGLARSKETERELAKWEEDERKRAEEREMRRLWAQEQEEEQQQREDAAAMEGVDGEVLGGRHEVDETADELAALTTEEYNPNASARLRRRGARSMAISSFSIRGNTAASSSSSSTSTITPVINRPANAHPTDIYHVLPALPCLASLSLGGEAALTSAQRLEWSREFESGWKEGTERLVKWALESVGERFERSRRKAESERVEWERWDREQRDGPSPSLPTKSKAHSSHPHNSHHSSSKGKGKQSSSRHAAPPKDKHKSPPWPSNVHLLRFPTPLDRPETSTDGDNAPVALSRSPLAHLISVDPSSDWRALYSDLLLPDVVEERRCVFCTIPEEPVGPLRRGGEDLGREGASGWGSAHEKGCGHDVGRRNWGDEATATATL